MPPVPDLFLGNEKPLPRNQSVSEKPVRDWFFVVTGFSQFRNQSPGFRSPRDWFQTSLCHLHGQCPPVVHRNFKTSNVLVDENFIAKVADAGISRLLKEISHDAAGPSHSIQLQLVHQPMIS
nr:proline-rich receptor-like protein kinase PERK3 [Ipomoea batatas]